MARVVPDALVALGSLHESARRWTDAAHAYKRLLVIAPDDDRRAQAIWRLAHVYETRKLFVSARDSYLELQARFPQVTFHEPGGEANGRRAGGGGAGAAALRPVDGRSSAPSDAGPARYAAGTGRPPAVSRCG